MKIRVFLISFFISLFVCELHADDGYKRNLNVDIIHYKFNVSVNDSTDRIDGKTTIKVKFLNYADVISLDLSNRDTTGRGMLVSAVSVNSEPVKWIHENDRLTIYIGNQIRTGDTSSFVISYNGIPSDGLIISENKFGKRTFFADHWPDRAHNYLPCIDHPYEKAGVDFIISAPSHYKVVASGILAEEPVIQDNITITHWHESVPLATKVMAFGVADFSVQSPGIVNNITVSSWVFPENRNEGFSDYSIAIKPLKFYSTLIGDYTYPKLANVQSKTIYGGLENAGTIFYSENSVTGLGRAEGLIAHEIAHQWFGNCVTESDWHHIWLSEGFATYLTSMYFESFQGKERLNNDMISARNRVLRYSERNMRPVIDTTVKNYMELLNPNSYQKGAWVLHMLRNAVGDEAFKAGLRLFYKRYYNLNVDTEGFQKVMEEVSHKNLSAFFEQWLRTAGEPELSVSFKKLKKKITEITVEQKQDHLFSFEFELLIKDSSGDTIRKIFVNDRITKVRINSGDIAEVIPDPNVLLLYKRIE
ncbi:MAG: M1 family metallopeptidase [Bacteroidales bacterium]|nr:M1 family metallopeptidase [Bacteroidales bacterium]